MYSLRLAASRFLVPLIWLHVPVIAAIALSNGLPAWRAAAIMAVAALLATLAVGRDPTGALTRLIVAGALTTAPMLMVYAGSGIWQADWHMYFFVVFGMLVAYVDWRPIVLSATLTALHHLILSTWFPGAVFPEADLTRVMLHASLVAIDSIVLFWTIQKMRMLFARAGHANEVLEARIAERTGEVNGLNRTLAKKLHELEGAFVKLESEAAQRKEIAGRLDHLAHHDLVTGLPNRVLLMDRLSVALANAERGGTDVLVMYLDLAGFKKVNDGLGHAAGDQALALIAARLRACMRTGETASRVGGDEFVIVCSVTNAVSESARIANRLIAAVSAPMEVAGTTIALGANVGISLFPADAADPGELIRMSDAAMYRAKAGGQNAFHFYTPQIHAEMLARSTLQRDLEMAIARDEFVVFYQPIISLTSRAIIGAEALVRWEHPTRGLLSPDQFVAFAEEHGLIAPIGEAVMRKACAQLTRFALRPDHEFTMAVNVSAIQFRQKGFVGEVMSLLAGHGLDSTRLEIEITESVIMDDAQGVMCTLHELADRGIKLSIDDFGTGYSSLAYIKTFPVQTLKIDRSFVKEIADNSTDQAIAATIITLAHSLGMRVIAEGIETERQRDQLRLLGADDMQGYLISCPLAAADFERFVCAYGAFKLAA